ncbi:hypothetical protein PPSIR1_21969 [Plesiocystis pacifica SIR-1]|uniref:Uncharacterized protein n=1 Tax=Plesiocystis pacifica SIR-1 TaxID=391625 RepID=A6FXP1_9BACT|nr:hypothetical protein [Plesiocystis pacifica]EDM81629.1 hypothetical protein PPSIR1_21969 [Plesiocystis pacifica SIR-1]
MAGDVGFAERKQFKLARRRAIEKMRRFALADPYFYILEIIQAAVAGGAESIDITCDDGDVTVSWIGGVLTQDELSQLFDFLFASKERVDIAHVRSLALGVNALMLFEPELVVIESGDGSEGGTARMVVRQSADQVDVGRAQGKLAGTYVRATKLNRAKVAKATGRSGNAEGNLEFRVAEQRCIAAPVPLVFNGQSLFGWSKQRVPNLFGYKKVRSFDEGDLYGTLGLNPMGGVPSFQLLTHGVWIQSYQHELVPKKAFGGVICFDRLHKTVDHAGFVRDERFEELWIRLLPYAQELLGGKVVEVPRITSLDGLEYTPLELRKYLNQNPRIIAVPPELDADSSAGQAVKLMSYALDAELLRSPPSQVSAIRVLGGRELKLWQPDVDDPAELSFYAKAELEPIDGPQLLPPVALEGVPVDVAAGACAEGKDAEALARVLGETGVIAATLYAPVDPGEARRGMLVQVTTTGRLLDTKLYATTHPGRILRVEIPTASPGSMHTPMPGRIGQRSAVEHIAELFAGRTEPALREQDQRTLAGLAVGKIEAGSPAARVAFQVLSRVTLSRLRAARPGRTSPGLSFSLLHSASEGEEYQASSGKFDPLALPLLRTLSGRAVSLRDLALLSDHTSGLIYGRVEGIEADLGELDPQLATARILDLDLSTERELINLIGDGGYVRVDARDRLAVHGPLCVRDVAVGLREYPEFPLLVEGRAGVGVDASEARPPAEYLEGLGPALSEDCLAHLVRQLRERVRGQFDDPAQRRHDPATQEEHRRQAVRHLQWIACRCLARHERARLDALELLDVPLFTDLAGHGWSLRQVHGALTSEEGLLVHYGHALGGEELALLSADAPELAGDARPSSLAASAFVFRLLAPLGRVRLAFDFDLDDVEATRNPMTANEAFLVRETVRAPWGSGVIGVPATHQAEYRVQLRMRGGGSVAALDEVARRFGLVGTLELEGSHRDDPKLAERIIAELHTLGHGLLERLITRLPSFGDDPRRHEAGLRVLLHYASEQLSLSADRDSLTASLRTPLAHRILSLPLFDTGATTLTSGQRLIEHFRAHFEAARRELARSSGSRWASHAFPHSVIGNVEWDEVLAARSPAWMREWLELNLHPQRTALYTGGAATRAQTSSSSAADSDEPRAPWPEGEMLDEKALSWNLVHWLDRLRTDPRKDEHTGLPPTLVFVTPTPNFNRQVVEGNDKRVDVHSLDPIAERVRHRPTSENLAWVLLAIYAHLNAVTGRITNSHEAQFQRAIADALCDDSLVVLRP